MRPLELLGRPLELPEPSAPPQSVLDSMFGNFEDNHYDYSALHDDQMRYTDSGFPEENLFDTVNQEHLPYPSNFPVHAAEVSSDLKTSIDTEKQSGHSAMNLPSNDSLLPVCFGFEEKRRAVFDRWIE